MALNASITDPSGIPMKLCWGSWHLWCMYEAAQAEGKNLRSGPVVLEGHHTFEDEEDGEVLVLGPGTRLETWR